MTTMAETYDAPMAESGEMDVSMYPTLTTADAWLSVEASMGNEEFASHSGAFDYVHEGVEVEMGNDDEPITEYEMADEGGDYPNEEEPQDIEVYDISEFSSPLPVENHDPPVDIRGVDAVLMHLPSSRGTALDLSHSHPTPVATDEASVAFVVEETTHPTVDFADTAVVESNDALLHHDATPVTAAAATNEPQVDLVHDPVDGGVAAVEPPAEVSKHLEFEARDGEPLNDCRSSDLADTAFQPHSDPGSSSVEDLHIGDVHADLTVEQGCSADLEPTTTTVGDPHEISEGVYIDPPPPVLLSLPPSADFLECSLFNLPTISNPHSPSSSTKPDSGNVLHLLLHERPTLYYEPLSTVFAALRQEQCIQSMPGFSEAELVIDAYDLQLSISEDNVYTHEVTLHELNVIHDGSDLSGPLRLRLKVFIPRFVTRYSTLRDQIARLNLTGDGEGPHTAHTGVSASRQSDPVEAEVAEQYHTEDDVGQQTSLDNAESLSDQGPAVDEAVASSDSHSAVADAVQEQAKADAAEFGVDSGVEEAAEYDGTPTEVEADSLALGGEDMAEEAEEEAGAEAVVEGIEAKYEASEDTLDADELHQNLVEEGGDYVEHAEFPDDEDDFGEDLPEELGGITTEVTDPQVHNVESDPEQTSFAEDETEYETEGFTAEADDVEEHQGIGLHTDPDTDALEQSNSTEDDLPDGHLSYSEVHEQEKSRHIDEEHVCHQENVASSVDGDGLNDNRDDAEDEALHEDHSETLSRKSSTTTLASRTSKRAYEEVDLDDFDDDDFNTEPSSPESKRPRIQ